MLLFLIEKYLVDVISSEDVIDTNSAYYTCDAIFWRQYTDVEDNMLHPIYK